MASSDSEENLQAPSQSHSQSTSSFSIKNLLNLPEERTTTPDRTKLESNSTKDGKGAARSGSVSPTAPLLLQPVPMRLGSLNSVQFNPLMIPEQLSVVPPCPAWVFATRYSRQGLPTDINTHFRRRRRTMRKQKQRPLFSQQQVQRLEKEFSQEKYLTEVKRAELSTDLKLTETQVKTWFQNRRTKWRKEIKDEVASSTMGERQVARSVPQPLSPPFGVATPQSHSTFTHSQALSAISLPSTILRPQPNNQVFLDLGQRQPTYYIH